MGTAGCLPWEGPSLAAGCGCHVLSWRVPCTGKGRPVLQALVTVVTSRERGCPCEGSSWNFALGSLLSCSSFPPRRRGELGEPGPRQPWRGRCPRPSRRRLLCTPRPHRRDGWADGRTDRADSRCQGCGGWARSGSGGRRGQPGHGGFRTPHTAPVGAPRVIRQPRGGAALSGRRCPTGSGSCHPACPRDPAGLWLHGGHEPSGRVLEPRVHPSKASAPDWWRMMLWSVCARGQALTVADVQCLPPTGSWPTVEGMEQGPMSRGLAGPREQSGQGGWTPGLWRRRAGRPRPARVGVKEATGESPSEPSLVVTVTGSWGQRNRGTWRGHWGLCPERPRGGGHAGGGAAPCLLSVSGPPFARLRGTEGGRRARVVPVPGESHPQLPDSGLRYAAQTLVF